MRLVHTTFYKLALILSVVSATSAAVPAQITMNQSSPVNISISVDSNMIGPQKPTIASVSAENVSGKEIDLEAICSFELRTIEQGAAANDEAGKIGTYWAPVNVLTGAPLKLVTEPEMGEKGGGRVPTQEFHLSNGEMKSFKVDLTQLFWNASVRSDWPNKILFDVVSKGSYRLNFRMHANGDFKSNAVEITIQ